MPCFHYLEALFPPIRSPLSADYPPSLERRGWGWLISSGEPTEAASKDTTPLHLGRGRGRVSFVILPKILNSFRQLMMHERGQHLLQLEEEPFSGSIAVGVHVKRQR